MSKLEKLKKYWCVVAQAVLWVISIVAGFVLTPKLGVPEDEQAVFNLAQLILSILLGVIMVYSIKFRDKSHLPRWFAAGALAIVLAVGAYFVYMQRRDICTCRYGTDVVLKGSELRNKNWEGTPCSVLLERAKRRVGEVWTEESISRCRLGLGISYVITVPLFVIGLMSLLQTLFIFFRGRTEFPTKRFRHQKSKTVTNRFKKLIITSPSSFRWAEECKGARKI